MTALATTLVPAVLSIAGQAIGNKSAARIGNAQVEFDIRKTRAAQEIDARRRRERLKRALATQRARFGAQGVGIGGSSGAVLGGLIKRSEDENRDAATLNDLRLAGRRRQNLLEQSAAQKRLAFDLFRKGIGTGISLLK
jgi:hypothetical protein